MGSGGVAIAALPTVICLKVPFSDGLGGVRKLESGVSPVVRLQSYIRLTIVKIISHYSEKHFPL